MPGRYRAALEMAAYPDGRGLPMLPAKEHHGFPDGWLPSPSTFSGTAPGARTEGTTITPSVICHASSPSRSPRWSPSAAYMRSDCEYR
jgi:hypothetical protein